MRQLWEFALANCRPILPDLLGGEPLVYNDSERKSGLLKMHDKQERDDICAKKFERRAFDEINFSN